MTKTPNPTALHLPSPILPVQPGRARRPPTSVLSFGAGQDSAMLLAFLLEDPAFRARYAPGELLVLMSDTGNEYPETNQYREQTARLCESRGVRFVFLTADMGFHGRTWPTLHSQWKRNSVIQSVAYNKVCSIQLKIEPIMRFINHFLSITYGYEEKMSRHRLAALETYAEEHGPLKMMIGFSAGEERRIKPNTDPIQNRCIERVYPLIERGLTRGGCQTETALLGHTVPHPSNCMCCPYASQLDLLRLAREYPEMYQIWVDFEATKLGAEKWQGTSNTTVFGRGVTIPQMLDRAEKKHGHLSTEELDQIRFTRGHANTNGF